MGASRGRRVRWTRAFGVGSVLVALVAGVSAPVASAAQPPGAGSLIRAIVTFKAPPGRAAERAVEEAGGDALLALDLVDALSVELPQRALDQLARHPLVERVEQDHPLVAFDHGANTGDHEYENAWGVEHIGAKAVHDAGIRGNGIKVAVIDTGLDYIHDDPDDSPYVVDPEFELGDNYAGGYDFYNDDDDPMDDNGHGTHVSGILAAQKNGYLVAGVAPEVELYALKILNANGEGEYSHLIAALGWAVDHDIDVVNMSLGGHEVSAALAEAVAAAHAAGVTMVAASGNVNPLSWTELLYGCPVAYPAAYPQVLATTFTNPNDALTGYSCTGPEVDFAAPGDQIFSPVPTGTCMFCSPYGYSAQSGTSMASPHLAGTVALLLDAGLADPEGDGFLDDARAQLCATANVGYGVQSGFGGTPIPPSDPRYPKYFGCGVVDADEAVLDLAPPPPPPPTNTPPVATDDEASVAEDGSATIAVLANDSDPDGDPLAVTGATDPAHGSATVNSNGTIGYTPDANYAGDDTFGYTVSDGNGGSDSATVTVHVQPSPDGPVATADALTVPEDGSGGLDVLANDSDPDGDALSVSAVSDPAHGTAVLDVGGAVSYTPDPNYHGADAFTYTVSDGSLTALGAVAVTVSPVNDPPDAVNDVASTPYQTAVTVSVLANDSDIDGGPLTVQSFSTPVNGVAAVVAGAIRYTPNAGFSGVDAFTYTVSDGAGGTDAATVSVTVGAAPPVVNPMHVADLDRSTSRSGTSWTARVTILIHRGDHTSRSGAIVTGQWSNGATGTVTCTTSSNGRCTVSRSGLSRATIPSVTFTVINVTRTGWTYVPTANHESDGDSNGTFIVVPRPS